MVDIGYWLTIILNLELLVLSHLKQAENIKPQTLIDWCILCARSWKEGGSWAHQIQCSYSLVASGGSHDSGSKYWKPVEPPKNHTQKPHFFSLQMIPNVSKADRKSPWGLPMSSLGSFTGFTALGPVWGNTSTFLDPLWTWQHASQAAASADVVLASASPGNRGTTE